MSCEWPGRTNSLLYGLYVADELYHYTVGGPRDLGSNPSSSGFNALPCCLCCCNWLRIGFVCSTVCCSMVVLNTMVVSRLHRCDLAFYRGSGCWRLEEWAYTLVQRCGSYLCWALPFAVLHHNLHLCDVCSCKVAALTTFCSRHAAD